jgi:hypothetical protein
MIIIIIAATVALAFLFGLIAYCCCCTPLIVPLGKKKKKKKKGEQEDPSPYTVHSYKGYVDSDDEDAFVTDTPTGEVKKRDNYEDIKKMTKDLNVPYKVYGPRGYVEGLRSVAYMKPQMSSNNFQPTDPHATWNPSPSEASIEDYSATRYMQQQSPGAASYSTVASSHHSTPSNISFVEQAKEQYLQLQEVSSGASVSSSTDTSSKSTSFIDQAKDRLRHYKSGRGDPNSSSTSTHSSSSASVSSSSSFVEQAKAKVKLYKQTREMLTGEYNSAIRVQIESSQSTPLVEEGSIIRSEDQKDSSVDDSRSSTSSYVEQAKASGISLYRQQEQMMVSSSSSSSSGNHPHPSLTPYLKSSSVNAYNVSAVSSDHSYLSSASVVQVNYFESINRSTNRPQLHPGPASKSSGSSSSSSSIAIHDVGAVVAQSRARYQALRKDAEKRLSSESNKSSDLVTLNTRDSSTSDNLHSDSDIFVLSNSTVTVKSSTYSSSGSIGIYQSHTSSNSSTSSGNSETRLEVSSSSEEVLAYDSHSSSIDANLSRSDGSYLDRI